MPMGNLASRFAMILRRKKVSPNQTDVPQRKNSDKIGSDRNRNRGINYAASQQFLTDSVKQYGEDFSVHAFLPFDKEEEFCENYRTVAQYDLGHNVEMMDSSNDCKSVKGYCTFPINVHSKEQFVSFKESFAEQSDPEDLHGILNTDPDIRTTNISHLSLNREVVSSQDTVGQGEKLDRLSQISKDGYSAEGTAGSGSFGDKDDDDFFDELLVDNVADSKADFSRFEEVSSGRKTTLTPLSLEAFNANQLDRRECVRNYIQAWSPLILPIVGSVESRSLQSYEKFSSTCEDSRMSPHEKRELRNFDSQSFGEFCQLEPQSISKPLSNRWDLLKNDRAPWIHIGFSGSEEVLQCRGGLLEDDQNNSWPMANDDHESCHNPNKGLTICSLSTINEESDSADRIEHL